MKPGIIIPLLPFLALSQALAGPQTYLFGKEEVEIWSFEPVKTTVSGHCISESQLSDCDATRGLKAVSFKRLKRAETGSPNPGALICEQQLSGFVMVGIDKASRNENSFCRLADGSIVDTGTLVFYGLRNDRANERGPGSARRKGGK